ELAFGEIDVVMDDGDLAHIDFVEARRRADTVAARIHIGLGLEQQHARVADDTFRESSLELWPKGREAIARGDRIGGHEADIVPGQAKGGGRVGGAGGKGEGGGGGSGRGKPRPKAQVLAAGFAPAAGAAAPAAGAAAPSAGGAPGAAAGAPSAAGASAAASA